MKSKTKLIIGILVLLIIASMAGAVTAKTVKIDGNAAIKGCTTVEQSPNSVKIEKAVNIKLENGAKVKATEGGHLEGHSTDADQRLNVSLDSQICASGEVRGTGTAVLNGSVKAEGWFDNQTDSSAVINTSITSIVDLDSGTKGSAEGEVHSTGTASATYNGTLLTSTVSGSSSASGKTQSASIGTLLAIGGITSESSFINESSLADALIFAEVEGENQSCGGAWASGNASATASVLTPPGNLTTYVTGSTKADGFGKGSGLFISGAGITSAANSSGSFATSSIGSDSLVSSGSGKYTATASSSASTPVGQQNTAYYGEDNLNENELEANTTGTARSEAAICDSTGEAGSDAQIIAFAAVSPEEAMMLGFGPEFAYVNFTFDPAYADGSSLQSDAYAIGSKVSAAGSTSGAANAALDFSSPPDDFQNGRISNTSAQGNTSARVNVQGCGDAEAESEIASLDLIGVGNVYFGIEGGFPLGDSVQIPKVPVPPDVDNPLLTDDLLQKDNLVSQIPTDSITIPNGLELNTSIDVLEISVISESASATSFDGRLVTAGACADGETAATGVDSNKPRIFASGNSSADGSVVGGAEAGKRTPQRTQTQTQPTENDPASASVILGVSAQGIREIDGVQFDGIGSSGLDATLIASTSGAGGPTGRTWGTATGDAGASGAFVPGSLGPSSSHGTVNTAANADGGLGLSVAAIGSADFATIEGIGGDLVDVAVIGTGSSAIGTAGAHAFADGQTEANGSILFQFLDVTTEPPTVWTGLNVTSDAFANGSACSDVQTKNGIALAADVLLAGEGTGASRNVTLDAGSGGGTAGSMVGQVEFAQQFGKSGSAKADARAEGEAGTSSSFYVDLGSADGVGNREYIAGASTTNAQGEVKGSANAGCGDPLSASAIVAFTDSDGGAGFIPDFGFLASGDTYSAGLVGSLSASWGKSAETRGAADGTAFADSSMVVNTTPAADSLYTWNTTSSTDGDIKTSASTKCPDGFALGVAAEGASSDLDASILGGYFVAEEHAITLDGGLSLAAGEGKATADVNKPEPICDKNGKVLLVPVLKSGEAGASSQFTAEINETNSLNPDFNVMSSSVSGSEASTSAEAAKGGFGLSLAGEASGSFTGLVSDVGNGVPMAGQDVFSVIADLAIADTDNCKETAKASGSASGDTNALSFAAAPNWNGTQSSAADGSVSAWAVGGDKCKDPLSASLILSIGNSTASPDSQYTPPSGDPGVPVMDNHDTTLIASFSATNGSKGDTGANACGLAMADGVQVVPEYTTTLTILSPTTSALTNATVWSHAVGNNGLALGVAGVGSSSDAHVDYNLENVSDQNLMFSYAAGEGFGKKATADACAGYDAVDTAASASNVFDRDPDFANVNSTSSASGMGISTVQASDANLAKALNFGWAGQNASVNFTNYSNDPANASHADAAALFGVEVSATNDAKGTTAYTNMTHVNLSATAGAGFMDFAIPNESASVLIPDGWAFAFLDPDGGSSHDGFLVMGMVDNTTFQTAGTNTKAADVFNADTSVDPNFGYWHAGAAADSDNPISSAFPPDFLFLASIPPV